MHYTLLFGCPFRFILGISCPGCGMTRAWLSLLKGDINGAFSYHPLVLLPILFVVYFMFRNRISKKHKGILLTCTIILFCGVYLVRLFDPGDTVVVFSPENGILIRLGRALFYKEHLGMFLD